MPWQVDDDDASPFRQVARIDPAAICLGAPTAIGEAKAQAGSIGAALPVWAEKPVDVPVWETAAFVLDFNEHALGAGADPERDAGTRPGELECVLQYVLHNRRKDLSVSLDCHAIFDGHHGQPDAPGVRLQSCRRREFLDESGHEERLATLGGLGEADLGERATNQSA